MEFVRLAISQTISKNSDFWPQNYLNLCSEHNIMFGVIKCISYHMTGHKYFSNENCHIFETVHVRHIFTVIHG